MKNDIKEFFDKLELVNKDISFTIDGDVIECKEDINNINIPEDYYVIDDKIFKGNFQIGTLVAEGRNELEAEEEKATIDIDNEAEESEEDEEDEEDFVIESSMAGYKVPDSKLVTNEEIDEVEENKEKIETPEEIIKVEKTEVNNEKSKENKKKGFFKSLFTFNDEDEYEDEYEDEDEDEYEEEIKEEKDKKSFFRPKSFKNQSKSNKNEIVITEEMNKKIDSLPEEENAKVEVEKKKTTSKVKKFFIKIGYHIKKFFNFFGKRKEFTVSDEFNLDKEITKEDKKEIKKEDKKEDKNVTNNNVKSNDDKRIYEFKSVEDVKSKFEEFDKSEVELKDIKESIAYYEEFLSTHDLSHKDDQGMKQRMEEKLNSLNEKYNSIMKDKDELKENDLRSEKLAYYTQIAKGIDKEVDRIETERQIRLLNYKLDSTKVGLDSDETRSFYDKKKELLELKKECLERKAQISNYYQEKANKMRDSLIYFKK